MDGGPTAVIGDVGIGAFFEHPDGLLYLAPANQFAHDGPILVKAVVEISAVAERGFSEIHLLAPRGGGQRLRWVGATLQ